MTTISYIAQRILDENNYTTQDISKTKLEYLIDNAIDYINMECGKSIADLSGSAESKSLTGTEPEIFMVKTLSVLMLRAYKEKGPQTGVGSANIALISTDPNMKVFWNLFETGLDRLRGHTIVRT